MLDIVKKNKEQEKQILQLKLVINDYIVDLAKANRKVEEYKTMYELEQKIVVADELKIIKAVKLIEEIQYFPHTNVNQHKDMKELKEILKGVKQ